MNHRCPIRTIKLINKIRSVVDGQEQKSRLEKEDGYVRLFILSSEIPNKIEAERKIAYRMAEITKDPFWAGANAEVKALILEHHMAARRMGFLDMFEPLYQVDSLRTRLLDGSLSGLRLFSELISPLVKAKRENDDYSIAAIVRKYSPLLTKEALRGAGENSLLQIKKVREAVDELLMQWADKGTPNFLAVLRSVAKTGLFEIPESLRPIAIRNEAEQGDIELSSNTESNNEDLSDPILDAWDKFLIILRTN